MINPNEAPIGYIAVAPTLPARGCIDCAFNWAVDYNLSNHQKCLKANCTPWQREDGHVVIFQAIPPTLSAQLCNTPSNT